MTEVLVERQVETPLADADVDQLLEDSAECRAMYRVDRHRSLLSADGRLLVCHLSSPDLESVRLALRAAGGPMPRVWACSLRDAPGLTQAELARANVFASWQFSEPAEPEALESIDASAAVCLRHHRVRFLRTFVSSDRRRVSSLGLAVDAESVRLALRDARWPVDRVWAFRQFIAQ